MTTVAQLTIEMAANVARLRQDMDASRRTVSKTFDGISKDVGRLKALLGGVFAGFGAQQTLSKLVSVQREFDVLNSSLITVSGSSMVAEREMRWIKEFATQTPYQLQEVTGAFVKMKALGLDASQRALASYGNTASAMGKSLNQMIEAVADASTGEFERLKEFGIKARQQGDKVTLTFRGLAATIGNNSREITSYLQRIGENDFAGAMTMRMNTLDGAISNLADTWDELFRTVSNGNTGKMIEDSVRGATAVLGDAVTIMQAMNQASRDGARDANTFSVAQEAMATVFETVAVMGANVKYVLVQVGTELGGIAAQAVQILQGNFAGAAAIRQQMLADSAAARREIDETTARVLNARRLAKVAATGAGMDEPRFARLLNPSAEVASSGGVAPGRGSAGAASASRARAEASKKEAEALRMVVEEARRRNRQFDEEFEAEERQRMVIEGRIRSAREMAEAIERETGLLGLSVNEREMAVALLDLERQGVVQGTEAYELRSRVIEAIQAKQQKQALLDQQKATDDARRAEQDDNLRRTNDLASSIEQGLLNGFRDGQSVADIFLNELKAQFAKTVLRPLIQPIAEAGNAMLSGLLTGLLSFDGGGYTGAGSRSGGMDGKGGYMAMLHPRETVIDHTKGGSGGGAPINIYINNAIGSVASTQDVVSGMQTVRAQIMGDLQRSSRYGGALAS